MFFSLDTPLSLYSIPFIYATAFYPRHNAKYRLINSAVGFDNEHPRSHDDESTLKQKGLSKEMIERCHRLTGAHKNGNEVFPLWVAAVLAANFAGVPDRTLNIASAAFVGLRLLYNYIYINQGSVGASFVRTITFFTSLGVPFTLLIKAGNKLSMGPRT